MTYYNDNDPKACAWLRELIAAGHLPPGDVDDRSITDVRPDDVRGYDQCHFFAGIGGWPLALRWAGLEGVAGIWTGSCPCQPFSPAGKRRGTKDPRHLWPVFRDLIVACRPAVVFGEQVASADVVGKVGGGAADKGVWLDGVFGDMEAAGYTCGAAVLGAHSVGAPHRRQRLYWVADMRGARLAGWTLEPARQEQQTPQRGCGVGIMADAKHNGWLADESGRGQEWREVDGRAGGMADAEVGTTKPRQHVFEGEPDPGQGGIMGNAASRGCGVGGHAAQPVRGGHADRAGWAGDHGMANNNNAGREELRRDRQDARSPWIDSTTIICRDGKCRRIPTEPELFPLAHGIPGCVGLLRGYGNAIVPQCAEAFIKAWMEATSGSHTNGPTI